VFLKTKFSERWAQFSPDGRWVAYISNESGRDEIYVRPFVEGERGSDVGGKWQVSTGGGIHPAWRPDGKELYYVGPDGRMMAAPIEIMGAELKPGEPVALFPARIVAGGLDSGIGRQYDVARDGRLLINTVPEEAASTPITLLQNWKPAK
jgi:Tol biopolymer transport system component